MMSVMVCPATVVMILPARLQVYGLVTVLRLGNWLDSFRIPLGAGCWGRKAEPGSLGPGMRSVVRVATTSSRRLSSCLGPARALSVLGMER